MHALLLSSQTITFRVIDASDGTPVAGATLRLDGCRLYATGLAQGDDTALTIGSEALTFPTTDAGTAPTALPSASPRTAYTYTTATRWLSRKKAIIYIICVFIPSGGVRRLCKMFFCWYCRWPLRGRPQRNVAVDVCLRGPDSGEPVCERLKCIKKCGICVKKQLCANTNVWFISRITIFFDKKGVQLFAVTLKGDTFAVSKEKI